jgi:CRISPR/Cas system-associated exonuclease Cas4 (RecB family)
MELPRKYISYSQVRVYQSCPLKYYYSYIEQKAAPIKDKVYLGIVFHATAEHYLKEKINGKETPLEVLLEVFNDKFDRLQADQEITWEDTKDKNRKRGIAFVKHFRGKIAPLIDPMMVEKELWAEMPGIDIQLRGVLDLVESDFSITDFKTTTSKWSKSRIKGSYLQMVIYRYLFEQNFGNAISRLKFIIVHSKTESNIKHQEIVIRPKDLDCDYNQMFDIIRYVVANIRNGVFYKNESYYCGFCEFREYCGTHGKTGEGQEN